MANTEPHPDLANVRALPGCKPPSVGPSAVLVACMREMLERAESGELQSLVGTGFTNDGKRFALWVDSHVNVFEMMGSLAWLQVEYARRHPDVAK